MNLRFGQAELACAVERGLDDHAELFQASVDRAVMSWREHLHAQAARATNDTFGFQPGIGLADGHRVNRRTLRNLPHAGQQVAFLEQPTGNQGMDLINDLPVDRHA